MGSVRAFFRGLDLTDINPEVMKVSGLYYLFCCVLTCCELLLKLYTKLFYKNVSKHFMEASLRAQVLLCGVVAPCHQHYQVVLMTRCHNFTQQCLIP